MPLLQVQFTSISLLWLLGCLVLGIGYAWLLYGSSVHLNRALRRSLFLLRVLAVLILSYLLFAPLIRKVNRTLEKPLIIIAQDNSASILVSKPAGFDEQVYTRDLRELQEALSDDYEVRSVTFGSTVKDGLNLQFTESFSDIASVFGTIDERFSNRNIGALILASDGIYNRGPDPGYEAKNLRASIYTIALGDTIPKRDILISNVNYNNIAYLDNSFQVEVSIEAFQSEGSSSMLTISDKSGTLVSKPVRISSDEYRLTLPLNLPARQKGVQQYNIRLAPVANELSVKNNSQTIFVEVIDGRQKIVIAAHSPHPDLAALKQSVESSKNYSAEIRMAGELSAADINEADLVILHQLPSLTNSAQEILKNIRSKPVLFILGGQSNIPAFSAAQPLITVSGTGNLQEALASFDPGFYSFTLSDATRKKIMNFAPLLSPFGNYALKAPGSVLMNQQIGKVVSTMPLLVFGEGDGRKLAVLSGEGIWRWRLEDFRENSSHEAIDELLVKTVQYLSTKEDRRKFHVYPAKNSFDENEHIMLNAELYNDAFELVNTLDVNVSVKTAGKSYSYVFSRTGNSYSLDAGILPAGEYSYSANTQLGTAKHTAAGQFVITEQQAEFRQTRANHQLLYALAQQSGGNMVSPSQLSDLPALIKANENIKTVSYEERTFKEPIDIKLVFFLILALLSIEWFSRKRNGEI